MFIIHPRKWLNSVKRIPQFFWYWVVPDSIVLRWEFKKEHHKRLRLSNPQTIDEKLQWIKLHDRKPIYHTMIDKIASKQFISNKIGAGYTIPLLGAWTRFEDIDFKSLPDSFVLKCNHDSNSYVIVKDKQKLNFNKAKNRLSNAVSRDYYHFEHKQWGYKDIPPMILAEEYLFGNMIEYQVFCNNSVPIFFLVRNDLGENNGGYCVCYSMDWKKKDYYVKNYPDVDIPKPKNFEKMVSFARVLSQDTLHLRVDYYETDDGKLYVGELTFYSHGGNFCNFTEEAKHLLSETLSLPFA